MNPHAFLTKTFKSVVVASPAVGQEWSQAVPAGVEWELISASFKLACSAVVQNRNVRVRFADGSGNVFLQVSTGGNAAANSTDLFNMQPSNTSAINTGQTGTIPIPPDFILPAGYTITTNTLLLDVGDQYSQIHLYVVEYAYE